MSLSKRLRPDVEAAPWVIEEVKKLEVKIASLEKDEAMFLSEHDENVRLHFENVDLKEENARLREALEFYAEAKFDYYQRSDEDFVYLDESDIEKIPVKYGDQYCFVPHYGKKARAALEGK